MSYIYLQEQGGVSSVESYQDIPQYVLLRLNLTHGKSCSKDSETESCHTSQSGTTSEPSMEHRGVEKSTSFAEDFLAKTFPQQEKELESRAREADSGERWPGWLAKYDQDLCLWKTPQCSLLEDYIEYSETWPKWGMMRDGVCWELTTSVRHIEERESGYLPTPTSTDATAGAILNENTELIQLKSGKLRKISNNGVSGSIGLARTVALWPTPDANMGARGTQPEWKPTRQSGQPAQYTINQAVRDLHGGKQTRQTYPTPQARDYKGPSGRSIKGIENDLPNQIKKMNYSTPTASMAERSKKFLEGADRLPNPAEVARKESGRPGQLNPDWVEWLMGWPIGWTKTEPIELDWRDWSIDPADINEVPRVSHNIKDRVNRLKAIGNGQVPLVAATAWAILSEGLV